MTTQLPLSLSAGRAVRQRRENMRDKIVRFFIEYPGKKVPSSTAHMMFGVSFRSRVSEINRTAECPWVIRNEVKCTRDGVEKSYYWAERKQ